MAEWTGVFLVNQLTPAMLSSMGLGAFAVLGALSLASALFALWLPETKGVLLEHMDQVFDARFGRGGWRAAGKPRGPCPPQKPESGQVCDTNSSSGTSESSVQAPP
uniref:Major facilitator superfamily (MFS) profile domain-containing protein n=1 Tax=Alexandrium monilatum TaxID=311494 RepID=A0A7S4RY05_9DINO|mmetsp:Transcript_83677/g.249733  ORF Transcript_83677/g.249733 Transcript_83677/m.249733 type:complete len:106 (+) Transcript_83677:915-1232(+)